MTNSAIQAAINIAAILGVNPMKILSIRPEDGSGYCWLFKMVGVGQREQFIDLRKGEAIEIEKAN